MFKKLFKGGKSTGWNSATSTAAGARLQAPTTAAAAGQPVIDAMDRLGEAEDLLTKRQDLLEKKAAYELGRAKEFTQQGNKRAALMALRKKRLYEQQLEQVETSILRLSEQRVGLESVRATAEMVAAMRVGTQASKAATAELGVEKVDQVLDELADQAEQLRHVQDVLGQPLGVAAELDEDELAAELEEMEAAQLEEARLEAAAEPSHKVAAQVALALPSTPATQSQAPRMKAQVTTPEETELEALQAEMAL